MRILITMCLLVGLTTENVLVGAEPPLEAYGRPPTVSAMAISPDGSLAAFRRRDETMDAVFVQNRETNEIVAAVNDFGVEVQRISFLDQNRLLLFASENKVVSGAAARTLQVTGTFVYDIAANSLSQLLANSINVNSLQLGLGAILAHNPERDTLYMPRGGMQFSKSS